MSPKDLKFPFKWDDRLPWMGDKVFFVPNFYDRHDKMFFPSWEDERVFGRRAAVRIEYCAGNGDWIIEKALAHPESNWVAVEKKFHRVRKIWSKMKNQGVSNLFIVCGEAFTFTKHYVSDGSFEAIYINFPDPWPKLRHAKHRLFHSGFLTEMARSSQTKAQLIVVTDHVEYASRIVQTLCEHCTWQPVFQAPYFVTEWLDYGTSFFDALWRKLGKTIHYLQFSL
ncbi:MAG TPA: tRNA (guanosine(46)-N7)-methyltransferase TrmB [Rhabdochlamydiaceae bacterium]|jgi:tRNA (guanine-N7-)-methyltransferase